MYLAYKEYLYIIISKYLAKIPEVKVTKLMLQKIVKNYI